MNLTRLRALAPFAQGLLGAVLILLLYLAGSWTVARYSEFVVMRSVVTQIIEQAKAAQTKPQADKK